MRKLLKRSRSRSRFFKHWALAPDIVFLNHGSFGACPRPILDLQTELRERMEAEPVQFLWRHYEDRLEPSRRALARFIGARRRDVVFVTNATAGVNAVLRSIRLKRGDELLSTSFDYNACRNVMAEAAARAGARLVIAPIPFPLRSESEVVEAVLSRVTRKTRLVMLDHVTSATGLVLPVERLVRDIEGQGVPVLIDGAHAPGMVPLNLARLNASYYTANLHKWTCAPKGAAFLWAREDRQEQLQPAVISHGNNTPRPGYTAFQDRFDWCGTFDPSAWFCVGPVIEWMGRLLPGGWREVRARNHELAVKARRVLCERLEVEAPCPETMLGSLATIPLPGGFQNRPKRGKIDREQIRLYDQFGIEVPFVRIGDPAVRYFRISSQLYNQLEDYEYLGEALLSV